MSDSSTSLRKLRDLELQSQQDTLLAIALLVSLVTPAALLVAAIPYGILWYRLRRTEKFSDADEAYIRELANLPRRVFLRKTDGDAYVIAVPFVKLLYVPEELLVRGQRDEALPILMHEKGHLQHFDFFIFVVLALSCVVYLLRTSLGLPSALVGCSIANPNSLLVTESFGAWARYTLSAEGFLSHRNLLVLATTAVVLIVVTNPRLKRWIATHPPITRSAIFLGVLTVAFVVSFVPLRILELLLVCDREEWNFYLDQSAEYVSTVRSTELFWGILTGIIAAGVIYTFGQILRRREIFADTFANVRLGTRYVDFLKANARPPSWQRSVRKEVGLFNKLWALLYPSPQRRLDIQRSEKGLPLRRIFARTFVWAFFIAMVCMTFFLGLATPEGVNVFVLKIISYVFGPVLIIAIGSVSNRWIMTAVSENRRAYAMTVFGALWLGLLAAQFAFAWVDSSLYDREWTLAADLTTRFWATLAYGLTVLIMAVGFFGHARYLWGGPIITLIGLLLAYAAAVIVGGRWDIFGSVPMAHLLMAGLIVVPILILSGAIRLGDYLLVRLRG